MWHHTINVKFSHDESVKHRHKRKAGKPAPECFPPKLSLEMRIIFTFEMVIFKKRSSRYVGAENGKEITRKTRAQAKTSLPYFRAENNSINFGLKNLISEKKVFALIRS